MKKGIAYITSHFKKSLNKPNDTHDCYSDKLIEDIQNELNNFECLDLLKKKRINKDIKEMIVYYANITDQTETKRNRLIVSSWETLAVLVTASGVLISVDFEKKYLIPIVAIFLIQIIFVFLRLFEYQIQSGFKYPFLNSKFGNKWKWFYYGNPFINKINPNPFQMKNRLYENEVNYLEGLKLFIRNYKNEDLDSEIQNNIQQLYLLQVHNFYKNKFYLRLYKYNEIANYISFGFLFLYLIYVLFLN